MYSHIISDQPRPLAPLGDSTDSYAYANGVIAYYRDGFCHIHGSATEPAIVIPCQFTPVIVAAAAACGLSEIEAGLLAEACETFGRQPIPYRVVPTTWV